MPKPFVIEPVRGRDAAEHITKRGFVWIDLALSDYKACQGALAEKLELDPKAAEMLGTLNRRPTQVRRPFVHPNSVAFPVWAWNQDPSSAAEAPGEVRPATYQVNVLIHGCALVTVTADRSHPPFLDADGLPANSEAHVVYLVLSAMFDSHSAELGRILEQMGVLEDQSQEGLFSRLGGQNTIARLRRDLTELRKAVGPERRLFDRLGVELENVEGLSDDHATHIERLQAQLDHIDDGISAVAATLSDLIGLRISAIGFSLTALATILTPIAVITALLSVDWVHNQLDTTEAGIGLIVVIVALTASTTLWIRSMWAADPTESGRPR
jgi:Mg2+ and Co2+ transporter CorA